MATSELIVRGHILGSVEEPLYRYHVSEVVYGDAKESRLVGNEIRVTLSNSEAGPVDEDSLLFIVSAERTQKGTVYHAQKYQWLEGHGWPGGSWKKLFSPTLNVIRQGRHLLFPRTEKLAYFWCREPRLSIMGSCLFVRARLAGVDESGSKWKVTALIKGNSAPGMIVIPHDEFRRRAEAVARDRYRAEGKHRPAPAEFKAEVRQVMAEMVQTQLPAKAVGTPAILAVDGCSVQEGQMHCRLQRWALEGDSGEALDALEKSIRHWMEADCHEVIRNVERW